MNCRFVIKAFQAVSDVESSLKFFEGHNSVLIEYGIKNLNTARPDWIDDPNVYVVNAYDSEGTVVGGLRVHKYVGQRNLPLINALEELDPRIMTLFESSLPKGTAEVCGLWNSKKIFGQGLSPILCMCSVAVVTSVGLDDFYCFSAPYTEKMIKTNGCVLVEGLGKDGKFNYPTEEFVSSVLYNPDVHKLEFAEEYNVERINSLRCSPHQIAEERSPRGTFHVQFELLPSIV